MSEETTKNANALPSEVQKRADKALKIQQQYIDAQNAAVETAETKTAEETQETLQEAPQEAPQETPPKKKGRPPKAKVETVVADETVPQEKPKREETKEYWKDRFEWLEGRLKQVEAEHKATALSNENTIKQLRDIIETLPEGGGKKSATPDIPEITITPEEIEEWGGQEQVDFTTKLIKSHLHPIENRLSKIESLQSEVANINENIQGMIKTQQTTEQITLAEKLDKLLPDWENYVGNNGMYQDKFTVWGSKYKPEFSEFTFAEQTEAAINSKNAQLIADIINKFKVYVGHGGKQTTQAEQTANVTQESVEAVEEEPVVTLEEQVTPAPAAGGEATVAPSDTKIFPRGEIIEMVKKLNRGEIKQDKYDAYERDYHKAMKEDRIGV